MSAVKSLSSNSDRSAALFCAVCICDRVSMSYTVTDQNTLPGTGSGTERRYDLSPLSISPLSSLRPSQYSDPACVSRRNIAGDAPTA